MAASQVTRLPVRYSAQEKKALKKAFVQTRRYQVAALVPAIGALFVVGLGSRFAEDLGVQSIVFGAAFLLLGATGFTWLNWRCPGCRKHLGKNVNPDRCPSCQLEL